MNSMPPAQHVVKSTLRLMRIIFSAPKKRFAARCYRPPGMHDKTHENTGMTANIFPHSYMNTP